MAVRMRAHTAEWSDAFADPEKGRAHATRGQLLQVSTAVSVTGVGLIVTLAPRVVTTYPPLIAAAGLALAAVVVTVVVLDEVKRVTVGLTLLACSVVAYFVIGLVWRPSDEVAALVLAAASTVAAAWLPWFLSTATVGRWLPFAGALGFTMVALAATFFSFPPPSDLTLVAAVDDTRLVLREGTDADVIEPVEASLEIAFDGCLKDPEVTLRLTRNGAPVRSRRIVVVDRDGNQLRGELAQVLAPRRRGVVQSCYLQLPRLLGASREETARARDLAQASPDSKTRRAVAVDVRSATTSVAFNDAQFTMVRGAAPDQEGSPSRWECEPAGPLDLKGDPLGCQGVLAVDQVNRRVLENIMLLAIGSLIGFVITLFFRAARPPAAPKPP